MWMIKMYATTVHKEVNLSSLHHSYENDITKLFHIKIQFNKNKVDALFDYDLQANLIAKDPVSKIGL